MPMRGTWWFLAASGLLFVAFTMAGVVLFYQTQAPLRALLVVFLVSMFLQCVAALQSLSLMRLTGWRTAWGVIAIAIVLMAVRRAIGFYGLLAMTSVAPTPGRLAAELVALAISVLMVLGIGWLAPLFRRAKEAEHALRSRESYLRSLRDALPDMTFVVDEEGRYIDIVVRDERLLAGKVAEVLGKSVREVLPAEVADASLAVIKETLETGRSCALQYELTVPMGRRWFEGRTSLMAQEDERAPRVMFVARDVTERVAAQEAYRVLAEQSIQGIGILQDGRLAYVNPAAARMTGWCLDELLRMPPRSLLAMVESNDRDQVLSLFKNVLRGGAPSGVRAFSLVCRDGRTIHVEAVIAPCTFCDAPAIQVAFIDITERKQIEEERARFLERLRQAQKWESLSTLAGGIAHNFNNLLQSILGFTELSKAETPADSPLQDYFDEIDEAVQRATALSAQMLACSGHGSFVFESLSLSDIVQDMEYVIESMCPEHVYLKSDLRAEGGRTRADRAHMRQLVLNLINNAAEAIGSNGGDISIEAGDRVFTEADLASAVPAGAVPPGEHPYLEIRDTGCGMDAETKSRAFDPFFSTKFTGRGLGMAAVLGIVRAHHAAVTIDSEPGKGTVVRAVFPALEGIAEPSGRPVCEGSRPLDLAGCTILIVDDEPVVREVATRLLERAGATVVTAGSGAEALQLLGVNSQFDCLLLDWTMPGMDSGELLMRIRKAYPELPVVIASGHDEATVRMRIEPDHQPEAFIQKPFGAKGIVSILSGLLIRG